MRIKSYIFPGYVILLLVMFILPFYGAEGYEIAKNTTSQLGAQNTPNSWIMNVTFCILGIGTIVEAHIHLKRYWVHKILLTLFGLGLISTGIFQHAPIIDGIPYSLTEDKLHSLAASVVGFSFTMFAFSTAFIEKNNKRRILAIIKGLISIFLSILMFQVTDYTGIWQRIMFITAFAWLIYLFYRNNLRKAY
ncbi:DUF998 domain-containing protein [Serpentinicella alkaliphila]|uniref:Uncharacterized protein DUF998 n=1 Tax=Serpentinicella alkaliphila TaxID=1734049 RepID=A0A4R2U206_9FIRM|nr:DUF998 domain-containing protein [Serpentinicella alkaliphila]QUH26203.1 DUF998 domain-containing protein [Serpentinicella alkaliphila]TCQ01663.1 uncharacterized protein DUF998 [Serpentinicella alkaliphila]